MSFDRYFDERSDRFAGFYGNESLTRLLGRGALFDRLRYTVAAAKELQVRRVLDVGCGSGPLFEPLAREGIQITGLEPAPAMIELAQKEAKRFPDLAQVWPGSWEDLDKDNTYDLAVALGVFDYVDAAEELLKRLSRAAPRVIASFPKPGIRTQFRKVRYRRGGVRVFGYSLDRVFELGRSCGLHVEDMRELGRAGYIVRFERRPLP